MVDKKFRLSKISVPENKENWYFITFIYGEHETNIIDDRHSIEIEVLVKGTIPLGEVEKIAYEKAKIFIKSLSSILEDD